MVGFLLYLLIIGLVAGFLARLLLPGPDPMSVGATIVLGIVGSFIGGFLGGPSSATISPTVHCRRRASSALSSVRSSHCSCTGQ